MDFSIIKKAALTQTELANLCDVSRVSINMWMSGRRSVHPLLEKKVTLILAAIKGAVEAKQLPLSDDVARKQRVTAIRTIVARQVTLIKAK